MREVYEADRVARRERFGKMTDGLVTRLRTLDRSAQLLIGVVFDPHVDDQALRDVGEKLREEEMARTIALRAHKVRRNGPLLEVAEPGPIAERAIALGREREALETEKHRIINAAIEERGGEVARSLIGQGYDVVQASRGAPIVFVRASRRQIEALAKVEAIGWLFDATAESGREQAAPSGIAFHKIDTQANAAPLSLLGSGQKVGLVENVKCAIHDKHDAFANAPATVYEQASLLEPCTDVNGTECKDFCKTLAGDEGGVCRVLKSGQKRCVDPHLSQVASGIWATRYESGNYQTYGAGKAEPYVWVGSSSSATNTACVPTEMDNAYDWFVSKGVGVVVGSYGCPSNSDDGFVEEWYAAWHDVAVFKATPSGQDETLMGRRPANGLCVGGMGNAHVAIDGWENFPSQSGGYKIDREEPDLVGLAGMTRPKTPVEVISLDPNNLSLWTEGYGSSFANPLVATIGILAREACGGTLDPRYLRAILMAGSWYYNPEDTSSQGLAFSTQPKPGSNWDWQFNGLINTDLFPDPLGYDYSDGAGGPIAGAVLGWCGEGDSDLTFDGGPLDLDSEDGDPFDPGEVGGGEYNLTADDDGGANVPLSYKDTNLIKIWSKTYSLEAQTRIRSVLTWDKCTPTSGPSGPYSYLSPTEDFDLYLCRVSNGECVAQSRSVYDNKEGFDVTVLETDDYELVVVSDIDFAVGCNGTTSANAAYATVIGDTSAFDMAP